MIISEKLSNNISVESMCIYSHPPANDNNVLIWISRHFNLNFYRHILIWKRKSNCLS